MQNLLYTACDSCAEILEGKKGTAQIRQSYITLKGSLCLYEWNEEKQSYQFTYSQKKSDIQRLDFCNFKHMAEYMEARRYVFVAE